MKVALYARVSTDDQDCGLQLSALRDYCQLRGWEVAGEYIDNGVSGAKTRRPEFDRLMNDARVRKCDTVAVWKLDRWGRSLAHLVQTTQELTALGVRFVAVTQNIDTDQSNPSATLLLHLMAAFAQFEREMIRERVTAGMARAKKYGTRSGKPIGSPPVVFRRDRLFELHAQGSSVRKIACELKISPSMVQKVLKSAKVDAVVDG
jgi:DNA invertase Pin-like site-specific DNA recombinase